MHFSAKHGLAISCRPSVCPSVQIFWVPLLSQERAKLWTSNFVGPFIGSIGTTDHEKMLGIVAVGVYSHGVPKIHGTHM